jgi:hypothetical protein
MIFLITIAILPLIFNLYKNYRLWLANKPVNHKKGLILVAAMYAPVIFLWADYSDLSILIGISISSGLLASWYWFLFDGLYNILRGFGWWFTGSDDADDARFDDFLQKIPKWAHVLIKTGLIILFTYLYFI